MGKPKETRGEFRVRVVERYPKLFRVEGDFLFCICCEQKVIAERMTQVTQHLETKTHKKNEEKRNDSNQPTQSLMSDFTGQSRGPKRNEFNMDLCKMLVDTNIPMNKITHPSFIAFLEKYTKQRIPSDTTLRIDYLPILYEETIKKLREKAKGKKIWITLDETTDVELRMVANFVFGILGEENEYGKSYLLNTAELDKTNANTIAVFFTESLNLLWPEGVCFCTYSKCIKKLLFSSFS